MLKISVSGVRGIVGESLTPQAVLEFGLAFGTFTKGSKIVIGRDTRISGQLVRDALVCGLEFLGCKIIDLGICPTPTVLFMARKFRSNGVIITASHNPIEWNGLKFAKKEGIFLNKQEMESLFRIYKSKKFAFIRELSDDDAIVKKFDKAKALHIDAVLKNIDKGLIKKRKFRIACDFCNGTGAVITESFLKKLGCKVYAVNASPDGRFAHNPEPNTKSLKTFSNFVKKSKVDLGLAQDPDADRVALCDENGVLISEEFTLAIVVKAILMKTKGKVVVNLSTSRMIDDIATEFGSKLLRTPVGEINVVEKMRKVNALVGGEGNGGVIYPKINFCRDSLVGIGIVLEYLARTGKSLSEETSEMPHYKMVKDKLAYSSEKAKIVINKLKSKYKNEKIDLRDGIKIEWTGGWVHLRVSNTEPIIRIVAEAKTDGEVKRLYNLVKKDIK